MAKKGNQGDGGGRPPKVLTPEQMKEVETLAAVLNTEQIADYFGISHVTFKAIRDRDENVSFAYKKGKARAIASVASNLVSQARAGNTSAQMFYLKTQAGWRETEESKSEQGQAININFTDAVKNAD